MIKLRIIPQQYSHSMTCGAILGQDTMRSLDLDTSIWDGVISWGEHQTAMVPRGYWTDERIQSQMNQWLKHPIKLSAPNSPSDTERPVELNKTLGEVKAMEALQPTDYKKADIIQVAHDCNNLSSQQQEKHFKFSPNTNHYSKGNVANGKECPLPFCS